MDAFKDKDCDINLLKNETVAIFGYGIQGRAQARNLRDSGVNVLVYNRGDKYLNAASADGFDILPPKEVVRNSSIIMMLIPHQAQKDVFDQHIAPNIQSGTMLVVAHGYSIRFGGLQFPEHVDVILLAPRFPGDVLRDNYLKDKGTLAFFDVHHDYTGRAQERGRALAKGIGFTKGGGKVLNVSLEEETEIDLFIEQYLIPTMLKTIHTGFDVLVENGYSPEVSMIELYTSGEIIGLLNEGIAKGMYQSFQQNTSPTCQYGVKESYNSIITEDAVAKVGDILENIKNGEFAKRLQSEASKGYPTLKAFNEENNRSHFMKTQERLLN